MSDREEWMRGEEGHGGFKSRDVLVHSCESTSCGGGEREDARNTRVWDRVRRQDQTNALCLSFSVARCRSFFLAPSSRIYPSFSLQRRLRRRGASPFPSRPSHRNTRATSFSLWLASSCCVRRVSLLLSLFLDDDSTLAFSLSLSLFLFCRSRPLLSALSFRATWSCVGSWQTQLYVVSIIIADI